MVVNAYFDVSWTGPLLKVDQSGKVVEKDSESKGKPLPVHHPIHPLTFIITITTAHVMLTLCFPQTALPASTLSFSTT